LVTVALDAMGGDYAPGEIVRGAVLAVNELPVNIILFGIEDAIRKELALAGAIPSDRIRVVHCPEVVEMAESPSLSYKRKTKSSIRMGLEATKNGEAQAFVSAGNTGAVMFASTFVLGRIAGVERPAIAGVIPTQNGSLVMLDLGSTVDCRASHLSQFAIMGHHFSKNIMGVENPRVGLLNIGEEAEKGNLLTLAAFDLIKKLPIRFVGNIEGKELLFDKADVVVCDGFVGNSLLKFGEGAAKLFMDFFKGAAKSSLLALIGLLFLAPSLKRFRKKFDYDEVGGAVLLGVDGVSIIAHGSASATAMKSAIRTAVRAVEGDMVGKIAAALK
jgi:glycerol-3-phosphate acyltransferase PlsX